VLHVGDPVSAPRTVSIIVPHYNDVQGLDRCLAGLADQTYPSDAVEIIVADNASPIGAARVEAAIAGRARMVTVTERGAGPARNGGAAVSGGEILAFIDSDCLPDRDWLKAGVDALADYDFVGGAMRVLVDNAEKPTAVEAFEQVFAFNNRDYVLRKGFTVTANLLCPRGVFGQVGGFRVGVSEDLDWCLRARSLGYRIGYAPGAVVGHPARRTWAEIIKKWRRLNVETYGLYAQRPAGRLAWLARCLAMPISAVAATPKVLSSRELRSLAQRASVLAVLFGLRLWRAADGLALLFRVERSA
jgi:GT2 family glycosyltransferase